MSWNQDLYVRALDFAEELHRSQKVPGTDRPYVTHLAKVSMEVMAALFHHPDAHADLAVACAILHDAIEDTEATFELIHEVFGSEVAAGVSALTKDYRIPKEDQMRDSLDRILQQPSEIAMVKLADRITNLAPPPAHWNKAKCLAYQAEAGIILQRLGHASSFLAQRLQSRIDTYAIPAS